MPNPYSYSIANDTANGALAQDKLDDEIRSSAIVTSLTGVTVSGGSISINFQADLSAGDETVLTGIVNSHDGVPGPNDPTEVHVSGQPPFADKEIPGYKLYRRVHGQTKTLAASGTTEVTLTVPYTLCKIDEIQMYWFPEGVVSDFTVEHPIAGVLSQHGFTVPVAKDYAEDCSEYDATLQAGLILKMTFTNNGGTTKDIGVAFVLHEMVAL